MSNSLASRLIGALAIAVLGVAPIHTVAAQKGLSGLATRNNRDGDAPTRGTDADSPNAIRPINVSTYVNRGTGEAVRLSWTPIAGASSIIVERSATPGGPFVDTHASPWVYNNLQQVNDVSPVFGKTMYYRVTAMKGSQIFAQSSILAITAPVPPRGITNLTADAPTQGTVVLKWTGDPEASSYDIGRQKAGGEMEWIAKFTKATTYTDTNLWNGATYTYEIWVHYPDPYTATNTSVNVKVAP